MIGKISRVPLREVWKHEAHNFTQWYAAFLTCSRFSLAWDTASLFLMILMTTMKSISKIYCLSSQAGDRVPNNRCATRACWAAERDRSFDLRSLSSTPGGSNFRTVSLPASEGVSILAVPIRERD